jgi:hypothetical protein
MIKHSIPHHNQKQETRQKQATNIASRMIDGLNDARPESRLASGGLERHRLVVRFHGNRAS